MLSDFTLLYVEDDKDTQEYMEFYLSDEVKEFYQAFDGEEGIEIYQSQKPDIIITDLNMPKLNGIDMIKRIKSIDREQIIIITSAFGDRDNLMEALNYGANGFISKPINIEKFNEKLLEVTASLKDKKEEKRALYNLAHYDKLTNIYNRLYFDKILSEIIDKKIPFSLFFIDLDNFKPINDTYGHKAGDEILKWVTSNILNIIREDDIFVRFGGDEFAIIIKNIVDIDTIKLLAQKIINATSTPLEYNRKRLMVSSSIGVSRYPIDTTKEIEILRLADEAMYIAKKDGKSNFYIINYSD